MVENTSSATLGAFMVANVAKGYTLITDSYPAYRRANAGYNHVVVDHTKDIYVVDGSTTNGFEGYWSQLKRGIYGIYHQVRPTHLGTLSISFISIY